MTTSKSWADVAKAKVEQKGGQRKLSASRCEDSKTSFASGGPPNSIIQNEVETKPTPGESPTKGGAQTDIPGRRSPEPRSAVSRSPSQMRPKNENALRTPSKSTAASTTKSSPMSTSSSGPTSAAVTAPSSSATSAPTSPQSCSPSIETRLVSPADSKSPNVGFLMIGSVNVSGSHILEAELLVAPQRRRLARVASGQSNLVNKLKCQLASPHVSTAARRTSRHRREKARKSVPTDSLDTDTPRPESSAENEQASSAPQEPDQSDRDAFSKKASPWRKGVLFSEILKGSGAPPSLKLDKIETKTKSMVGPVSPGKSVSSARSNAVAEFVSKYSAWTAMKKRETVSTGLVNLGNMCFLNAITQVLAHTPPFYNLIMGLGQRSQNLTHVAPITENFIEYLHCLEPATKARNSSSEKIGLDSLYETIRKTRKLDCVKGAQEDAEEFLGHILNGIHEELLSCRDGAALPSSPASDTPPSPTGQSWMEVGPKNRSLLTRSVESADSPITRIFTGRMRSALRASGTKDSVTIEPFNTLQLDITSDDVKSVAAALTCLTAPETIDQFMVKGKTVPAQKQLLLHEVPPVLTLQVKRFTYDPLGGYAKIRKPVKFSETLELDAKMTTANTRKRLDGHSYQLYAVVNHHGRSMDGGHYTAAIKTTASTWKLFDDTTVQHVPELDVLNPTEGSDPYLLFYILIEDETSKPIAAPGATESAMVMDLDFAHLPHKRRWKETYRSGGINKWKKVP